MSKFGQWNGVDTGAPLIHDIDKASRNNNYAYEAQRENIRNYFNSQSSEYEWPVFSLYQDPY